MSKLKLTIPDDQKARLVQALVTLLTVLLGIALTLGTQVVDQLVNPVGAERPAVGAERPAVGAERPAVGAERPAVGAGVPTAPPGVGAGVPTVPGDVMQSLGTTHFTNISAEDLTATDDLVVTDDADIGGSLTVGTGNLYPLGIATDGYGIYCNQSTFTGTQVITTASHGLTTPAVVLTSLASAPDDDAGDPFIAYAVWSGSTVTLTVAQDDGTNAASAAVVDYCMLGAD
jgi:hypothetical protein